MEAAGGGVGAGSRPAGKGSWALLEAQVRMEASGATRCELSSPGFARMGRWGCDPVLRLSPAEPREGTLSPHWMWTVQQGHGHHLGLWGGAGQKAARVGRGPSAWLQVGLWPHQHRQGGVVGPALAGEGPSSSVGGLPGCL